MFFPLSFSFSFCSCPLAALALFFSCSARGISPEMLAFFTRKSEYLTHFHDIFEVWGCPRRPLGAILKKGIQKDLRSGALAVPRGPIWASFWHQNRKNPAKGPPEDHFGRIPERSWKNVDFGSPPDVPNRGFPLVKQAFLKVHRAAKKHGKVAHLGGILTPLGTFGHRWGEKCRKRAEKRRTRNQAEF